MHVYFDYKNVTFEAMWRQNEFGEEMIYMGIEKGRYFVQYYYLSSLFILSRLFDQIFLTSIYIELSKYFPKKCSCRAVKNSVVTARAKLIIDIPPRHSDRKQAICNTRKISSAMS